MKDNSDISQESLEIIERYIKGSMTSQELKDFNQLLELDYDFKLRVEDIKTILTGIEAQSLKEQLDEFHENIPKTIVEKPIYNKVRYLNSSRIVAAAAIVIAVCSIWFFSTPQNEKLYAKYFKPDPGLPTTMSSTRDYDFNRAMVSYKQGNYEDAIKAWEIQLVTKVKNDTLNYFIGSALLADKKNKEAIEYLNIVTNLSESLFKNEAYYYLGLAYLKNNNIEFAKKNLTKSTTDDSKALLSELTD